MAGTFSNAVGSAVNNNIFGRIGQLGSRVGQAMNTGLSKAGNFIGSTLTGIPTSNVQSGSQTAPVDTAKPRQSTTLPTSVSAPTTIPSQSTGNSAPSTGGQQGVQTLQSPSTSNTQNGPSTYNPSATPINNNIYQQSPTPVYTGTTRNLAGAEQGNLTSQAAAGGLLGIAAHGSPQVQQQIQNIKGLRQTETELASNPNLAAEVASGRGQAIAGQVSAAENALQNTLTGQGQQITAGQDAGNLGLGAQSNQIGAQSAAGSLTSPTANAGFFGSPEGNPATGGTQQNGGVYNQAISQAVQLAGNNANPDAIRAQLVSSYGAAAGTAFDQAMLQKTGGKYNPTAASASSQQTASQGADTGGQAYQLNLGLQQVETIKPVINSFMSTAGINTTDSPLYNKKINDYIGSLGNPGAMAQFNLMTNDLQKFSSQILAAGAGGTPTGVQMATDLQNPRNLSLSQINDYLTTLKALGGNQLSVLQEQAKASGYTGYAGNPTSVTSSVTPSAPGTAPGSGLTSPTGQFLGGVGLDVGKNIAQQASNLTEALVGYAAGKLK